MNPHIAKIVMLVVVAALTARAWAFPPYIPLKDRFKESDIVILGDIIRVDKVKHTTGNSIARLRIRVKESLKGKPPQKTFSLTFLVFPDTEESHLIRPPEKGSYIIFIVKKRVRDFGGRSGTALVLYEPRVYACVKATAEKIRTIQLIMLDQQRPKR